MIVEIDCALGAMSPRGLFKSMLLKYYSNKNLPTHLPILPNNHSQSIQHFWGSLSPSQVIRIEIF